jgi:hypothetical protein
MPLSCLLIGDTMPGSLSGEGANSPSFCGVGGTAGRPPACYIHSLDWAQQASCPGDKWRGYLPSLTHPLSHNISYRFFLSYIHSWWTRQAVEMVSVDIYRRNIWGTGAGVGDGHLDKAAILAPSLRPTAYSSVQYIYFVHFTW